MTCSESTVTCIGCAELPRCKEVTAQMIVRDDSCPLYEPAEPGVERGRLRILDDLGPIALLQNPKPRKKKGAHKLMATRPNLRKLALASGVMEKSAKIFQLDAKELNKILETEYPGIEDMDDDDVIALIDEARESEDDEKPAKKKKAAAKKPATRKRRTTKKVEPAEEEEEEEEAPAKKTRRRTKAAAEPEEKAAPKRRTRRAKKAAVEAEEGGGKAATAADLGELPDKIDTIGGLIDDLSKKVKDLATSKELSALDDKLDMLNGKLDALDAGLVILYNEGVEESEEIGSCLELVDDEG